MKSIPVTIAQNNCNHTITTASPVYKSTPSASKFSKESATSSKTSSNIALKIILAGLTIGVGILAGIKICKTRATAKITNKPLSEIEQIQSLYEAIFHRKIDTEEAHDFVKRYKTILDRKYNDDKALCDRLLEEICKERNTKKPKILRFFENENEVAPDLLRGCMATSPDGIYIDIYAFNYKNTQNPIKRYFEDLFHETHHVKQDEIIYRTDKEKFLQKLIDRFTSDRNKKAYNNLLKEQGGDETKTLNLIKEQLRNQMDRYWGMFEPFAKNSAEYEEGLRLIQGTETYKFFGDCKNMEEYQNQIIEKGAHLDGENAGKLFDLLTSIKM